MTKINSKGVIFSLDDFGISGRANKNILRVLKKNGNFRVSVMINGKISEQEITALKESECKIDLHLTIPARNPFSQKREHGIISRSLSFLQNYLGSKVTSAGIDIEWSKQLKEFVRRFHQNPDGLNSHEHTHFFPSYFRLLLKLATNHKIAYIRFGSKGIIKQKSPICRVLSFLWNKNKDKFFDHSLPSSEYLISLDWIKNPLEFFSENKKTSVEIVCHPERKKEFELLRRYLT